MKGHSVVGGWVDEWTPHTYDVNAMARELARREDARLLGIVSAVAGLPYRLHTYDRPNQFVLEVRVPGVRLAAITRETVDHLPDTTAMAVHLGRLVRQGWDAFTPLPLPAGVVLGEN